MSVKASVTAIVPMKPLAESKTRLSGHLRDELRAEVSAVMLESVLAALGDSDVSTTIVVGGDTRVRSIAAEKEAGWNPDRFNDLNLAVRAEFRRVWNAGGMAAYFPGDLPILTNSDINGLMELVASTDGVTICPAHDGGTNALVVPAGLGFSPRLGNQSSRRHRGLAMALNVDFRELWTPGFELDVDTIDDLHTCLHTLPSHIQSLVKLNGAVGN